MWEAFESAASEGDGLLNSLEVDLGGMENIFDSIEQDLSGQEGSLLNKWEDMSACSVPQSLARSDTSEWLQLSAFDIIETPAAAFRDLPPVSSNDGCNAWNTNAGMSVEDKLLQQLETFKTTSSTTDVASM